jgi:uncharacterized SAM-binding protein YcdF (DUF218 family)
MLRHEIRIARMFNFASKFLFLFIDPPTLILILLGCSWMIRKRWSKVSGVTFVASVSLLFLLSCPAISERLLLSLEGQYPGIDVSAVPPAPLIVVLGGSMNLPNESHHASGITNTSDRLLAALRLYRAGKSPQVLVSGGNNPLMVKTLNQSEADAMRDLLKEWGVQDSAILVENASINTHENALFTFKQVSPLGIHHIILVTSAIHMPRAAAAFRKAGFEVTAVPSDFHTGWDKPISVLRWLPASSALLNSSNALHEWLGLFVYRLRGWS